MDDATGIELLGGEIRGMLADAQRDPNGANARLLALYNAVKRDAEYLDGLASVASTRLAQQAAQLDDRKAELVAARTSLDAARGVQR